MRFDLSAFAGKVSRLRRLCAEALQKAAPCVFGADLLPPSGRLAEPGVSTAAPGTPPAFGADLVPLTTRPEDDAGASRI